MSQNIIHKSQKKIRKKTNKIKIKSQRLRNENEDYAYFRNLVKSRSATLCLKLPRVLKFALAGNEFHTVSDNELVVILPNTGPNDERLTLYASPLSLLRRMSHIVERAGVYGSCVKLTH